MTDVEGHSQQSERLTMSLVRLDDSPVFLPSALEIDDGTVPA